MVSFCSSIFFSVIEGLSGSYHTYGTLSRSIVFGFVEISMVPTTTESSKEIKFKNKIQFW